ncbi:hypothetical protein ACJRO7_006475 [Eucalyptus globulus]|uniref:Uncharacterized protein n=1 Tax=Eucalyptus globulus TaxID=34317 RepID=A0ABD3IL81_EUCGL
MNLVNVGIQVKMWLRWVASCDYRQLILYPNGDRSRKGEDHMFPYLAVSEANPLKVGWEINATVRFSVVHQIRDEYLAKEGTFVP